MNLFKKLLGKKDTEPEMPIVNLQSKTKALRGTIEWQWFENENIGLKNTLFHRISIPLSSFDSGFEFEAQPVNTCISIEWLNLKLKDPTNLDGIRVSTTPESEIETSIYIGSTYNPCDIINLVLNQIDSFKYKIEAELFVDFEHGRLAKNEKFSFVAELDFDIPEIDG